MKFWKNFLNFLESLFDKIETRLSAIEQDIELVYEQINIPSAFEANEDPIYSVSDKPVMLLSENEERHNIVIQNIGLLPCYIRLGEGIKIDNYHIILAADTEENQGNGGSIELKNWHGRVYALCEKETKVSVLEY